MAADVVLKFGLFAVNLTLCGFFVSIASAVEK